MSDRLEPQAQQIVREVSVSPEGEIFPLPDQEEALEEVRRLERLAAQQRLLGREIVVVMGGWLCGGRHGRSCGGFNRSLHRKTSLFRHGHAEALNPFLLEDRVPQQGPAPGLGGGPGGAQASETLRTREKALTATFAYEALFSGRRGGGGRAV